MSLQQGVNQLLGMTAATLRLSPGFEERTQLQGLNRKIGRLDKVVEEETKKYGSEALNKPKSEAALEVPYATHEAKSKIDVQRAELLSQIADIRPSTRNMINARHAKHEAMTQLVDRLSAKLIQRDKFDDLMNRLAGGKDGK